MKVQELKSPTGKNFLIIHYDEQNQWIYNDWAGYVSPENVMQGSLAVLDAIKKYRVACVLNDNRRLVGRWDDSVDWIGQEWTPKAAAAGLQHFAHVVDADTFAAASSENMLNRVQGRFHMRIFRDIDEAKEWLVASHNESSDNQAS
jgi:hypothetical protein